MRMLTLHLLLLSLVTQSNPVANRSTSSVYPGHADTLQQTDADSITLTVTVTDKRGGYIKGLGPSDFKISQGKSKLEISSFSFGDEPASVGIVYDASLSMRRATRTARPKVVKQALDGFVRSSNASNSYFLITFSDQPQLVVDWTHDREALLRPVEAIISKGQTALYDACAMALEKLRGGDHRKRVILLLSDGMDNHSGQSYRELRRLLMMSDVLLYAIAASDGGKELIAEGSMVLDELSSVTGGGAVHPRSDLEVIAAAEQVAFELSRQYRISFNPGTPEGDKWRELKIKVTPHLDASGELQNLTVRNRRGYFTQTSR